MYKTFTGEKGITSHGNYKIEKPSNWKKQGWNGIN